MNLSDKQITHQDGCLKILKHAWSSDIVISIQASICNIKTHRCNGCVGCILRWQYPMHKILRQIDDELK